MNIEDSQINKLNLKFLENIQRLFSANFFWEKIFCKYSKRLGCICNLCSVFLFSNHLNAFLLYTSCSRIMDFEYWGWRKFVCLSQNVTNFSTNINTPSVSCGKHQRTSTKAMIHTYIRLICVFVVMFFLLKLVMCQRYKKA